MITLFNTGHVKAEVRRLLGADHYAHSDGSTLVVHAGHGAEGRANAEKIIAQCKLPATSQESERLGSFNDRAAWEAKGVLMETFVLIRNPARP